MHFEVCLPKTETGCVILGFKLFERLFSMLSQFKRQPLWRFSLLFVVEESVPYRRFIDGCVFESSRGLLQQSEILTSFTAFQELSLSWGWLFIVFYLVGLCLGCGNVIISCHLRCMFSQDLSRTIRDVLPPVIKLKIHMLKLINISSGCEWEEKVAWNSSDCFEQGGQAARSGTEFTWSPQLRNLAEWDWVPISLKKKNMAQNADMEGRWLFPRF